MKGKPNVRPRQKFPKPERDARGCYKKGYTGNCFDRRDLDLSPINQFRKALREVASLKGKTLLRHFTERAYEEDHVLTAAMKKILPDLQAITQDVRFDKSNFTMMTEEELDKKIRTLTQTEEDRTSSTTHRTATKKIKK